MRWRRARAPRVLAALRRTGWAEKRRRGSHVVIERAGWPDFVWAFHERDEVGPKMLARIAKRTGLEPRDP